jgi:hypothetical protein
MNVRAHLRALGPTWTHFTPLLIGLWPIYVLLRGELRWEMFALAVIVPTLAFTNATTRKLYVGLFPLGAVAVVYDAMRYVKNLGVTPDRVHVCDLRDHELRLFGVTADGVRMTLQDYFQMHPVRWLDFVCAVPYGTFIFTSALFATYIFRKDFLALQRYAWTFLLMNIVGFVTYHVYPAAPPWYFHAHGCVVDLASHASEGPNLMRVDAALGVGFFHGFYGRASDVFGAVPSLHVAYPLLILLEGYKHFRPLLRALAIAYFLAMCFAAVYLDHHWVIDVLVGLTYGTGINAALRWLFARRKSARSEVTARSSFATASGE